MDAKRLAGRKRNVMADLIRKGVTHEQMKDAFKSNRTEDVIVIIDLPPQNGGRYCHYRPASSIKHTKRTGEPKQKISSNEPNEKLHKLLA